MHWFRGAFLQFWINISLIVSVYSRVPLSKTYEAKHCVNHMDIYEPTKLMVTSGYDRVIKVSFHCTAPTAQSNWWVLSIAAMGYNYHSWLISREESGFWINICLDQFDLYLLFLFAKSAPFSPPIDFSVDIVLFYFIYYCSICGSILLDFFYLLMRCSIFYYYFLYHHGYIVFIVDWIDLQFTFTNGTVTNNVVCTV